MEPPARLAPSSRARPAFPRFKPISNTSQRSGDNASSKSSQSGSPMSPPPATPSPIAQSEKSLCGRCEQAVPVVGCEQCQTLLCQECSNEVHSRGVWKSHVLVAVNLFSPLRSCITHSQPLDVYDEQTQEFICVQCVLGDHRGNPCTPLNDAVNRVKQGTDKLIERALKVASALESDVAKLASYEQEMVQRCAKVSAEIHRQFDLMREMLLTREAALLVQASTKTDEAVTAVQTQRENLQSLITQVRTSAAIMDELIQANKKYEVIEHHKILVDAVSEGTSDSLLVTPAATLTMDFAPSQMLPIADWGAVASQLRHFGTKDDPAPRRLGIVDECPVQDEIDTHQFIYAVGGYSSGLLSIVERYSVKEKDWETVAPLTKPRSALSVNSLGGFVYAMGGDIGGATSRVERYNPELNEWTTVASMNTARYFHASAVVGENIFVCGGYRNASQTAEVYNAAKDIWTPVAKMRVSRNSHAAVGCRGDMYVVGGWETANLVERYIPDRDEWVSVPSTKTARRGHALVELNGEVYAIGGDSTLCTVEKYSPQRNVWSPVAPMLTARVWHAAVAINGEIYVIGGQADGALDTIEKYIPAKNRWMNVGHMSTARYSLGCAAL